MRILENSGPIISLALMIAISEAFLQRLEDRALQETQIANLAPLMHKRYVDDSHARFETVHQSHSFLNILNKQNTMGKENQSQKLNIMYNDSYSSYNSLLLKAERPTMEVSRLRRLASFSDFKILKSRLHANYFKKGSQSARRKNDLVVNSRQKLQRSLKTA